MNLINLCLNHGDEIIFNGEVIKYFEIAKFNNELSYGVTEKGWLQIKNGFKSITVWDEVNYINFISFLEISYPTLNDEIGKNISSLDSESNMVLKYFPLFETISFSFKMESVYWTMLSLDFLLEGGIYNKAFYNLIDRKSNEKWFSQKLKHKIDKYLSRFQRVSIKKLLE